ncbi:hypothetical protein [Lewinella sp. LCG006]|uniref:sulfotransferase-like domain-containing protein n=1 Tax=Lewinella sp. LCG006 TaxID=3231911 RepID=UPI003460C007
MKIINLWSSPRNISTALMYSFAQRPDTTVVDEPLYAYYLANTNSEAAHPGVPDIMASQSADGDEVVTQVILGSHYPTPVVVHKQMTHHLLDLNRSFLHQCANVMLIRDPRAILASYTKVIQQPTPFDIGIPQQDDLYAYLKEHQLLKAIVDARVLLQNPRGILQKLCDRLEIPFTEKMLTWPAGALPEDGVWAKYWYSNVHASTGFKPYQEKLIELPAHLEEIARECQPAYERLLREELLVR